MSQKITSKNLSYNARLPPFLAALHEQAPGSGDDGLDAHLASRQRRAARPRSGSEEAEDAPVVVDEAGNVVAGVRIGGDGSVGVATEEQEVAIPREDASLEQGGGRGKSRGQEEERRGEKVAGIGGAKKRKVGRVVGFDGEEERGERHELQEQKTVEAKPKVDGTGSTAKDSRSKDAASVNGGGDKPAAKLKKTAKKIKLSFGDDGE